MCLLDYILAYILAYILDYILAYILAISEVSLIVGYLVLLLVR
jgi:hypothetical protein